MIEDFCMNIDIVINIKKGSDLLSHLTAVPSAQMGLTSLLGMGRGEPHRYNHLKSFSYII